MAKVRIISVPKAKNGFTMGYGDGNRTQYAGVYHPDMMSEPNVDTRRTLGPVNRENANVEAEKGETVVTNLNGDNIPEHYNIGGKKHSAGGTPLNLPEDSFIFSDTKDMRIKNPAILDMFNKPAGTFTPADIAKKYDINKYRKFLGDPETDKIQKDSSERMIANYNKKLAKLALVQESMKGFPQGLPKIAEPYLATSEVNPTDFLSPVMGQTNDIPQGKMGGALLYAQDGKTLDLTKRAVNTYVPYVTDEIRQNQRAKQVLNDDIQTRLDNQLYLENARRLQAIEAAKKQAVYDKIQQSSIDNLMQNQLDIEEANRSMQPLYGNGSFLEQFIPHTPVDYKPVLTQKVKITKPVVQNTTKTKPVTTEVQVTYTDEVF